MRAGKISARKLDQRINSGLAVNVSENSCCAINGFHRGEIELSHISVISSSESQMNLNLQEHIHIRWLHEERYDVYCVLFLVIS